MHDASVVHLATKTLKNDVYFNKLNALCNVWGEGGVEHSPVSPSLGKTLPLDVPFSMQTTR